MKLQIVLAVLFAFAVCAESQYIDNSYIVQLKDGSTEAHIEEVIQKIEDHTMTSREEMEITSCSSALPLVFGKFGKDTAEMVSFHLYNLRKHKLLYFQKNSKNNSTFIHFQNTQVLLDDFKYT